MVVRHPAAASNLERSFYEANISYVDGRSFLTNSRISGSDDEEIETRSMAVFGN